MRGTSPLGGDSGCAQGLSGVSGVGYWWGFSGVHVGGSHCSGARETRPWAPVYILRKGWMLDVRLLDMSGDMWSHL